MFVDGGERVADGRGRARRDPEHAEDLDALVQREAAPSTLEVDGPAAAGRLGEAIRLMQNYDAIADTVARARHYAEMARDALAPMKSGYHKDALVEVLEFCVARAI